MRISDWSSDVCSSDLWAAAHLEALGGEATRLRPREVIANFRRWTLRELDLRREAASASELADAMTAVPEYEVPAIEWDRTACRVMTMRDRKRVVEGKSGSVRVDIGGRRLNKKIHICQYNTIYYQYTNIIIIYTI